MGDEAKKLGDLGCLVVRPSYEAVPALSTQIDGAELFRNKGPDLLLWHNRRIVPPVAIARRQSIRGPSDPLANPHL